MKELFEPESIAVIGASSKEGKVGNLVFKYVSESKAKVYPVNPNEDKISGCYRSIKEIEDSIDLAIICTPAKVCAENVRECSEKGVKYVIPVAGGFGEAGVEGKRLEDEMKKYAGQTRILGPNTLGIFVPEVIDTMFLERKRSPRPGKGRIALVSQSGATAATIMNSANLYSIGFSAFVGLGNRIDLNENDFIDYFSEREDTGTIALYLESFADGFKFKEAIERCKKPVVLLKAGRSAAGAKAAASHTGALAGSDRIVSALCDQYNISRVYDEEELIDVSRALAYSEPLKGDRIAVLTTAGGHGVIATDYITSKEKGVALSISRLSEKTNEKLKKLALPFASLANPVDLTASATDDMYLKALDALIDDENTDGILASVLFDPPGMTEKLIDGIIARKGKKPLIVYTVGAEMSVSAIRRFEKAGIPAYPSIWRGVRALYALYSLYARRGNYE
jgi:acyl-CoA synthetase (NDP forming)